MGGRWTAQARWVEEYVTAFRAVLEWLLGVRRHRRPRRRGRHPMWRSLRVLGSSGVFCYLLADGQAAWANVPLERVLPARDRWVRFPRVVAAVLQGLPDGLGDVLWEKYGQGGWKAVQVALAALSMEALEEAGRRAFRARLSEGKPPQRLDLARNRGRLLLWALVETMAFERAGFVLKRCEYRDHPFVSDDPRRKDCVVHRLAGQKARWRERRRLARGVAAKQLKTGRPASRQAWQRARAKSKHR